jgi:DMSO/TMAO reductase YedYZ molybdopterin-dependent catalytic subunit
MTRRFGRRSLIKGAAASLTSLALAGCDRLGSQAWVQNGMESAEEVTRYVQALLLRSAPLAREYSAADISPDFRANGTTRIDDVEYQSMAEAGFADWRLAVDGLVEQGLKLSLEDLRGMPSRTQITRHDCVEGWSCIGQWTGVPLGLVLERARLKPRAKYIVFRCADSLEQTLDDSGQYYESIGLEDAFHAQTILAYEMNGKPLPVAHGAPLRLRVERQLGYKMAKFIMRIEAVDSFAGIGRGKGGFWEDRGYEWYAGI